MAAVKAVQGGRWPPQPLVWEVDGVPVNLAGATLTGTMTNRGTGVTRAISEDALVFTNAAGGEFAWYYGDADVAEAGEFDVEFVANFESGPTPGKTFLARWSIAKSPSGG
jgi:hypothetical protein